MSGINIHGLQEIHAVTEQICDPTKHQEFINRYFKDFDTYKRAIKLLLLLLVNTRIKDGYLTFNILNRSFPTLKDKTPFLLKVFILLLYNIKLLDEVGFSNFQVGELYSSCIYPLDILSNEYYQEGSIVAESFNILGIPATVNMLIGTKKELVDIKNAIKNKNYKDLKLSNLLWEYSINYKDVKKLECLSTLDDYRSNYYKKIKRDIFLDYLALFKITFQHVYEDESKIIDFCRSCLQNNTVLSLHEEDIHLVLKKSYFPYHNNLLFKHFKSIDNFFYKYNQNLEKLRSTPFNNEQLSDEQVKKIISNQCDFHFPNAFVFVLLVVKNRELFQRLQWTSENICQLSETNLINIIFFLEQSKDSIEIFEALPFNIFFEIIKADSILVLNQNKVIVGNFNDRLVNFIDKKIRFAKQFNINSYEIKHLLEEYKEYNILTDTHKPILHANSAKKARKNKEKNEKLTSESDVNNECKKPENSERPFLFELDQVNKHIALDDVDLDAIINLINNDDINNKKRLRSDEENMLEENESKATSFSSGPMFI